MRSPEPFLGSQIFSRHRIHDIVYIMWPVSILYSMGPSFCIVYYSSCIIWVHPSIRIVLCTYCIVLYCDVYCIIWVRPSQPQGRVPNCTPLAAFHCAGHLCADCADFPGLYFAFLCIHFGFLCVFNGISFYLFVFLCISSSS